MTIEALSKFHNSVVGNPPSPTRVLLKLNNTKQKLIAVQEPHSYFQKMFYLIDLFLHNHNYQLSTVANYLHKQKFTDPRSKIYLESVNKKIEKHNDNHPHDPIKIIHVQDIAKKSLIRTPSRTDPLKGPEDDELVAIAGIPLTRKTMRRMLDGNLLNDELINAYMELINKRNPKTYCLNTFFLEKLLPNGNYCYDNVKRWLKNIDVLSYDRIMVPVHVHNNHWCLAVINVKEEKLEYYDSLQLGDTGQALEHLQRWLQDRTGLDLGHWTKQIHTDIPLQTNAIDCGVFTCQYANSLARGSSLTFNQSQIPAIRHRMIAEFLDKAIR